MCDLRTQNEPRIFFDRETLNCKWSANTPFDFHELGALTTRRRSSYRRVVDLLVNGQEVAVVSVQWSLIADSRESRGWIVINPLHGSNGFSPTPPLRNDHSLAVDGRVGAEGGGQQRVSNRQRSTGYQGKRSHENWTGGYPPNGDLCNTFTNRFFTWSTLHLPNWPINHRDHDRQGSMSVKICNLLVLNWMIIWRSIDEKLGDQLFYDRIDFYSPRRTWIREILFTKSNRAALYLSSHCTITANYNDSIILPPFAITWMDARNADRMIDDATIVYLFTIKASRKRRRHSPGIFFLFVCRCLWRHWPRRQETFDQLRRPPMIPPPLSTRSLCRTWISLVLDQLRRNKNY